MNNINEANSAITNEIDENNNINILKIDALNKENKRLREDLKALTRNFEALCLKIKEDKNLIKRLEDELSSSKNKINKDEIEYQLKNYKNKYEQLADSIKAIEQKSLISSQNCKKYQENELKLRTYINKLEERLKKTSKLETQNFQLKKQNEQQANLFSQENKKLEDLNQALEKEKENLLYKLNDAKNELEQMKKENELVYKLLDETRSKLENKNKIIDKLNEIIKNNKSNSELEKYKKENNDLVKLCDELKEKINILTEENSFYKNLNSSKIDDKIKFYKIVNKENFCFIFNKKNNNNYIKTFINNKKSITNFLPNIDIIIKGYEDKINKKLVDIENKYKNFYHKISIVISDSINKSSNDVNNNLKRIVDLQNELSKKNLEISDLNKVIKKKDLKIVKIKNKKKKLKEENQSLTDRLLALSDKQKTAVDISEIKKLFVSINEIIGRLKLTMETFSINLNCKNCLKMDNNLYQLNCGHSLCQNCFKTEENCIECHSSLNKENPNLNKFANNIIVRYKYAQQQIESDIGLVISTLKDYFK